jgi:hypothetical protein
MKNVNKFLLFFSFLFLTLSCSIIYEGLPEEEEEETESDFEPEFKYSIYGDGLSYDSSDKYFSYTFIVKNEGNIGIFLRVSPETHSYDEVFEIGKMSTIGLVKYSHKLYTNEFNFDEGKVGFEISPNKIMKIKVTGFIQGDYAYDPNTVHLHKIEMRASRYDDISENVNVYLSN